MKSIIRRLHWILSVQFGINFLVLLKSLRGVSRYIRDWLQFRAGYSGEVNFVPCLHDWYEEAGSARSEYFWQDLIVARRIFDARPVRHVDVGSRIDGFVAHVAVFREIEVFDVRAISTKIENIRFTQADMMSPDGHPNAPEGCCDSLSCLHALEHFGLGRYGDPIDPYGYERGLANMARLLKKGGLFYLSVPVGRERVEFNANRIFDPRLVLELARSNGLQLHRLTTISPVGEVQEVPITVEAMSALADQRYMLGLFVFIKE
jgi:SAM-dependent methyltransferase